MKRRTKTTSKGSHIIDTKCGCTLSGNLMTPPQTITGSQKNSTSESRKQILHDMKRIAIAVNQLCRDLDRIENGNSVDNNNSSNIGVGVERPVST